MKDRNVCPECNIFWEECPCCGERFCPACRTLESDSDYGDEGDDEDDALLCPFCGDEMTHWNQGIYECKECNVMIPDEREDEDDED
ncbi:hypothetical protein J6TS7_65080 [Paenibacillus dendritiformis]|uniref:hypothetical protein n=1 Tax=Paenibacillus TaxID=44249 RepID=UPI001B2057CD|nr:hypothetical protein [Paenibacillus dendritiformis]GIO82898.1 hypothetical protein J6TS7_65080 [Paenibacillus dendritiformis]